MGRASMQAKIRQQAALIEKHARTIVALETVLHACEEERNLLVELAATFPTEQAEAALLQLREDHAVE